MRVRFLPLAGEGARVSIAHAPHLASDLAVLPALDGPAPSVRYVLNSLLFSTARIADLHALLVQLCSSCRPGDDAYGVSLITDAARSVLPDPTASLDWEGWRGAIPDILHRNAEAHPDRVCVVQSLPDGSAESYTYGQVDAASNVLANHLISAGVKREDVVTLYAARSADMAAAVMGVLKTGGIFNVLDPAYPVERQKIYLGVARPRALVVLAKAGEIHPDVLAYIDAELPGIPKVVGLAMTKDGTFASPSFTAPDAKFPGVELGPDSPATLSFTSGSTGLPKGVKGRHFSLTHFYPWMASRFGLSSDDRFTMLSGIAHDPIQRDIFTPLFLGAQLRVPTADDIATPGRLAEWMRDNACSVTHLTPAMGQLLTANASARMPALRSAFFVGDVLTLRDVRRLQALAPGCAVVNMYGTTETQRAVSHYVVPPGTNLESYKEVVPAGKGMHDVQLLVVCGEGEGRRTAGIGEVGELYVRSGGLAEGYLEGGEEKFVANFFRDPNVPPKPTHPSPTPLPFFFGPRDRMYRTGDLGRYLPTGDVECTGRKDDQVKIRGFRIELGEIDTHLSQCPKVRENVTRVRRDRDEEQVLVSYIVPQQHEADHDALAREIRAFLSSKLPAYAVPTVFVVLKRMPLTPNGKVDKNALPFPDTPRFRRGSIVSRTTSTADAQLPGELAALPPTTLAVLAIWADLLAVPPASIRPADSFFDLGGHSILATRLVFEMRRQLGVEVPLGVVFNRPSLEAMAAEVDRLKAGDLDVAGGEDKEAEGEEYPYAAQVDELDAGWAPTEEQRRGAKTGRPRSIFLTGATGFLGAFILRDLLADFPDATVTCLVRADTPEKGVDRVRANCAAQGVWDDAWASQKRIRAVTGDLGKPRFGLGDAAWTALASSTDAIVHNGATVHWVFPYTKMRSVNVLSTVACLELSLADPKGMIPLHFVSTTAVLDTQAYVALLADGTRVLESDDLARSAAGLKAGYGQTKWVSEKLLMRARGRGCAATIVRPGYILGDSKSGVTNTDDFLIRLMKGCITLGIVPEITNVINMVPVDYVSKVVSSVVGGSTAAIEKGVFQIWQRNMFRFIDLFRCLRQYGYPVEPTAYIPWRTALMDHTLNSQDNALYPLLHFVMDDLPTSTKGPELDDGNTREVTGNLDCGDMGELVGLYISYLIQVGFLEAPPAPKANGANGTANGTAKAAVSESVTEWFEGADAERKALPVVELTAEMKKLVARNRE
ncbi:L-aminoadipate-semialdehyde dehydrogenase [Hyaloraphidium curvatum]|nr:L-aminoadipate-semialdehyde dehydrogenase [Hyaloraphidium curvatum]